MNSQMEDMHREQYGGNVPELSCPLMAAPPSTCSATQKLSKTCSSVIFMEASSCSHDQLLSQSCPSLLPGGWGVGLKVPSF